MIDKLTQELDQAVGAFLKSLPPQEASIYGQLLTLVRELSTYQDGTIKNNLENVRKLARIKRQFEDIILSSSYLVNVNEFVQAFHAVEKIQNTYFSKLVSDFTPKAVLGEVKKQAISNTVDLLTENGIARSLSTSIYNILDVNIKSGGSYSALASQLRETIIGNKEIDGGLTRYASQITTDSINTYSAQYTKIITDDLGLKWYRYLGSLLITSRPFCVAMVEKSYVHVSEFKDILNGNIDGKKVSLAGVNKKTTPENFQVLRGGHNCGHQMVPISEVSVPKSVRIATYDKYGIKYDEDGFAKAG